MRVVVSALLTSVFAFCLSAQVVAPSACTYDTCALRIEEGRLLRGITSERIARFGLRGPRMADLVAGSASDSARWYAREFDKRYRSGNNLILVGALISSAAFAWWLHEDSSDPYVDESWTPVYIGFGGLFVEAIGAYRAQRARRALSRSIWWYNRELTR